jgi:diguanylate cyclase (GGDEF)-like protein
MRTLVTPAATSPSASHTPAAFARRMRTLRIALAVTLAVAVALVVALVTQSNRSGVEDAYRAQARADATAVARQAVGEPEDRLARELKRLQATTPDLAGIAVYGGSRQIASRGTVQGGLVVEATGSGNRIARVAWDTTRVDAAVAERNGGFPLNLTLAVAAAALLAYLLISQLGLRRLGRLAADLTEGQQSLEELALSDPLTGLPNKRAFNDRLEAELGRAAREYYPVSVVAMDLDKFKQINDTWGHAVGDEALKKLAGALQETLRAGDLCGRLGGDEFMLALVRADAPTAEKVMQRIKDAVAPLEVGPGRQKLKFSAGIAEFPRHSTDMEQLVNQADAALYWGKAHGRDRWHIYSAEAGEALGSSDTGGPNDGVKRRNMLATLQQLAKAVDAKNRYTTDHSDRVCAYAVALGKSLKLHADRVERIRTAALLHDVGKIGVPTPVLLKEAPLNLDDLDQLARHSELGHAMIAGAGMPEEARIVFHVHERWDGGGFPDKLAGEKIPIESRIIGAADALDRATRPTAHRRLRPLREALAELEFAAGTKLDPDVCARMLSMVRGGEIEVPGHESGPQNVGDRRVATA